MYMCESVCVCIIPTYVYAFVYVCVYVYMYVCVHMNMNNDIDVVAYIVNCTYIHFDHNFIPTYAHIHNEICNYNNYDVYRSQSIVDYNNRRQQHLSSVTPLGNTVCLSRLSVGLSITIIFSSTHIVQH